MRNVERRLTSRNLPDTTLVHRENVFVDVDFDSSFHDKERHMHASRVLGTLHAVFRKFNTSPAEERIGCICKFREFEARARYVLRYDALLTPCERCVQLAIVYELGGITTYSLRSENPT